LRSIGPRAAVAGLVGALVLVISAAARADDAQALEMAKSPFDNGQYAEAHKRLSALLDTSRPTPCTDSSPTAPGGCKLTTPELIERARALDAASLLALKRDVEADQMIGTILRQNPNYVPSPAVFPQEVIDRFNAVRLSIAAELRTRAVAEQQEARRAAEQKLHEDEERWIAELQRLASRERVVETNSRWLALVPFGIGQFLNGDLRWGITFAVGETLLGGVSLTSLAVVNKFASVDPYQVPAPRMQTSIPGLNKILNDWTETNQVSFALWAALTLTGIVHAQVNFVPERVKYRDRPIPPRPKLAPIAAPVPHGAVLGLGGTF
jgi:hypothetical protein